ncbi:hypothetical protein [Rhizobium gallicum]|uniref:hypothetical protein n=1 Tax=Rhizobium gallicum TaxID=56730 RepID=UPI001EF813B7|nr:hypothetical protein [Rhizobium gallicum]ULJ73636.1 hypothetical protein L2W42_08710 [Rhizobium gallicum]
MAEQSIGALASKIVSPWAWYQAALKNPSAIGKTLPIHGDEPQQGYFRTKNRDKGFDPVAIFYPEGASELVAYRAGREVRPDEVWTFCCKYPVTFEAYNAAMDGKGWPDDDATVAAQVKPPEPGIGDNSGEVDEAEAMKDQIEAAKKGASTYATIKDDAHLAKAQSLRSRLLELKGEAEKKHKKEKEPHLEAGRAVDKRWLPLSKDAEATAKSIRASMETYETAKLQAERKRQREADQARLAAEQAAREQRGETSVMEQPAPSAPVSTATAPIKGTYGKAASVSVKKVVTEVTDWRLLAEYMIGHPDLQTCLRDLAQRAVDRGHTVPGIVVEEKAAIR